MKLIETAEYLAKNKNKFDDDFIRTVAGTLYGVNELEDPECSQIKMMVPEIKFGMELANRFSDFINGNDGAIFKEYFVKHLLRQHRTLQASVIRLLFSMLKEYGDAGDEYYDLRNEAAVKACQKLEAPAIPFI